MSLLKIIFVCYKMANFGNQRSEKLMVLVILRNADSYNNMTRQQLEGIFASLFTLKSSPRLKNPTPAARPKKGTSKKPIPASRPKKYTFDDYKPKKIAGVFDDSYIE